MLPYLTIAGAGNAVGTLRPPLPCVALMGNACRPAELQERRSSTIWAELSLDGPGAGTPPTTRPQEKGLGSDSLTNIVGYTDPASRALLHVRTTGRLLECCFPCVA
jgi:hypothetical protein